MVLLARVMAARIVDLKSIVAGEMGSKLVWVCLYCWFERLLES